MNTRDRLFEVVEKIDPSYKTEKKKKGFYANIEKETIDSNDYRKVLYTTTNLQLVLMSLKPREEIGMEVHPNIDQFFRFESGIGKCIINDNEYDVKDGDSIIVPAGAQHNIINTGEENLQMYTIYSPPHHKDAINMKTKALADKSDEEFDGTITEK
jgi:mannose-6-phosphate isomerase-like protein (cupin superfamily)